MPAELGHTVALRSGGYYNPDRGVIVYPGDYYHRSVRDKYLNRSLSGSPIAPTSLHFYDDNRFINFLRDLYDRLSNDESLKPAAIGGYWTGANAIPTSFDSILSIGGVPMTPRGFVAMNSANDRVKNGLSADFGNARQREIFKMVAEIFFEDYTLNGIRIRDGSLSGPPFMVNDKKSKLQIARNALSNDDEILTLINERKLDELRRKHSIVFLAHCGGRLQQETPFKKRAVVSPSYAAYGIEDGNYPEFADKEKPVRDLGINEPFCAQRARVVTGIPTALNVIMAKYMKPYDDVYTKKYPLTFKNRDARLTADKFEYAFSQLSDPDAAFVDVTAYDRTVFGGMRDVIAEVLSDVTSDERVGLFYKAAMSCAYYIPASNEDVEEYGNYGYLFGDPDDIDHNIKNITYLLSGTFATSFNGRFGITANHMVLIDAMHDFTLTKDDIRAYLSWDREIYMLNGGDDHVVIADREVLARYFSDDIQRHSLFKVEREQNSVYLGNVFYPDVNVDVFHTYGGLKNAKFKTYPNLVSFISKTFSPERGFNHRLRKGWADGLKSKLIHYSSSPSFNYVLSVIDDVHLSYYGFRFSTWVNSLPARVLSDADAQFIDNPDVIYYKLDERDISPELLAEYMQTIKPDEISYTIPLKGRALSAEDIVQIEKDVYLSKLKLY